MLESNLQFLWITASLVKFLYSDCASGTPYVDRSAHGSKSRAPITVIAVNDDLLRLGLAPWHLSMQVTHLTNLTPPCPRFRWSH